MAADYQQLLDPMTREASGTILRVADNAYIPADPANRDRQLFEEWLADGNRPDPPEPLPEPAAAAPAAENAAAALVNLRERVEALEVRMLTVEKRK